MAKKLKLPKRIAGIKIPKTIRKGSVGEFMSSPAGQLVIAEALVAAAGVGLAPGAWAGGARHRPTSPSPCRAITRPRRPRLAWVCPAQEARGPVRPSWPRRGRRSTR